MKCKHCGAKIADDSVFCEYCGKRVEQPQHKKVGQPWYKIITFLFWGICICYCFFRYYDLNNSLTQLMVLMGGGAIVYALIMAIQKIRNQYNDKSSDSGDGKAFHPEN